MFQMESPVKSFQVVSLNELSTEDQLLVSKSVSAREKAYIPYSNFKVGAALKCDDGTVITGCNVENASYGLSICAERTAIVKAVSDGKQSFVKIAVSANNNNEFVAPCGACRQFLSEFTKLNHDIIILLYQTAGSKVLVTSVKELLPLKFEFK
ncbi:cytidine deaminase-like [Daktulosphaira vitifoliae]|uniref:cytidine deaminase-like n=1 Tax=Daktulosphaira vitifoliae TaxID=58002 RepID=UPI0021A9C7C3|nr:cytidine deaminase-like [Daktulosphaira vitifoliae]